jgi:hypothetical protein
MATAGETVHSCATLPFQYIAGAFAPRPISCTRISAGRVALAL